MEYINILSGVRFILVGFKFKFRNNLFIDMYIMILFKVYRGIVLVLHSFY